MTGLVSKHELAELDRRRKTDDELAAAGDKQAKGGNLVKIHPAWKPMAAAALLSMGALSGCSTNNTAPAPSPPASTVPLTSPSSSSPIPTPTASSSSTPTATGGAPTSTAPSPGRGCAPTPNGRPTGAATGATVKQIIDADDDGRPDTGWIGGSGLFGITTASGATFSTVVKSASPNPPAMLVANIDGSIVALASDQRAAALLLVKNCALVPARNAQGSTYYFDLGAGVSGTGVGCSQVAGTQGRSLVGLKLIRNSTGNPQSVERTQIIIDGTQARNGAHDTVSATGPQGAAAAASVTQISCGDLTMATNGVHSG